MPTNPPATSPLSSRARLLRLRFGNQDKDAGHRTKYELSFGKRPTLELYDLNEDPGQIHNLAASSDYAAIAIKLGAQLESELMATGDPRMFGKGQRFSIRQNTSAADRSSRSPSRASRGAKTPRSNWRPGRS